MVIVKLPPHTLHSFFGPHWFQITHAGLMTSLKIAEEIWWNLPVLGSDNNSMRNILNSLTPGRFQFNIRKVIFKLTLVNGGWGIAYEIALRWMPQDLTDDKSIWVQVMAWCRQATSHYLSQCWPISMSPNGVTRPQWVKNKSISLHKTAASPFSCNAIGFVSHE